MAMAATVGDGTAAMATAALLIPAAVVTSCTPIHPALRVPPAGVPRPIQVLLRNALSVQQASIQVLVDCALMDFAGLDFARTVGQANIRPLVPHGAHCARKAEAAAQQPLPLGLHASRA